MITQFKIFEKIDQQIIDNYLISYNKVFKKNIKYILFSFNIPDEFSYVFSIIYELYHSFDWKTGDEKQDDNIRKEVKKYAIDLMIVEFEKNILSYEKLKYILENQKITNVGDLNTRYVFYVFNKALDKAPQYIKNTKKYNI